MPTFTLKLLGDRGLVEVQGKQGVARVAPGRYWVLGWTSEVKDERGLIPAIVQDAATLEVVALAYLDDVRLARALQTGETRFFGGLHTVGLNTGVILAKKL